MPRLERFLADIAKEVDYELEKFFPRHASKKLYADYFGEPEFGFDSEACQMALNGPIWNFLSRGGKRWRPCLMLLACEALGGFKKTVLPFTPIPELIHNGTIIVDDVQDNSTLRRGKPSLHIEYGVDIAVNAGNALYFLPLLSLVKGPKLSLEKK